MNGPKPRVLILGAGVAGLSTAWHLAHSTNWDVTVLEATDRVGGLATSFTLGPAVFDFGPHAFHSQEPRVIQFFQTLMAGDYRELQKDVAIQFNGQLYPYPLNPARALRNMAPSASLRCGASYAWNLLTNFKPMKNLRSSEEFFVKNFGWELYRTFFEAYTWKVWGIHPRDLSIEFIKNRLPSANLARIVWAALSGSDIKIRKPHEVPLKLRIFYPNEGSIQFPRAMQRQIEQKGGRVLLNCPVQAVELVKGRVAAVRFLERTQERRLECETLISTIPLTQLVQIFDPLAAPEVLHSSRQLTYRPILIACLWIQKPRIFPQQTIYYTNRIYNRLAQMNSYSATITPPGTCGVTAELTCRVEDELWRTPEKELLRRIVADMEKDGLLSAAEVKDGMVLRNIHGYPIYHLGFEEHLQRLRQAVHEVPNLFAAGRQGMFNYAQMHFGVSAGMRIAEHMNRGGPKPLLPANETEEVYFA